MKYMKVESRRHGFLIEYCDERKQMMTFGIWRNSEKFQCLRLLCRLRRKALALGIQIWFVTTQRHLLVGEWHLMGMEGILVGMCEILLKRIMYLKTDFRRLRLQWPALIAVQMNERLFRRVIAATLRRLCEACSVTQGSIKLPQMEDSPPYFRRQKGDVQQVTYWWSLTLDW